MKGKRLLAAILAAVMLTGVASAAGSSFSDVRDEATAVNADILRLMGVVNGSGENRFSPEDVLTRAQFCAMAVRVLGRENEVRGYEKRTIFTDVASRHWARGYVNLAANITIGDGTTRLIAGVGNGKFLPDDTISWAQAVTIVLRMLGYGDDKAGAVWPQGYLDLAAALNLGAAVNISANGAVTRAQAAQLFADLLVTKTASGQRYYTSLGSVRENVILFSVDPVSGELRTSEGLLRPAVAGAAATALTLRKGTLVLNERGEAVVFLPVTDVTSLKTTLRSDASATRLHTSDGRIYPVDQKTFAVVDGVNTAFAPELLKAGAEVELVFENGKLLCVVWNQPQEKFVPGEALVVQGPVKPEDLAVLTGGVTDFSAERDGLAVSLDDLKPYDAVTYDPVKKLLTVSAMRLSCVYEEAYPNPQEPTVITVLGNPFPVLRGAAESIRNYSVGERVTLLLTADGAVAGMGPADLGGTAIGLADGSGVSVPLANGEELRLSGTVSEDLYGRVVRVTGEKAGGMKLSAAYPSVPDGEFDPTAMTLGTRKVTPNVRIYEGYDGRVTKELRLADLGSAAINAEKIVGWYENAAGAVRMIVVEDLTGDSYTYGILSRTAVSGFSGGMEVTNSAVNVKNGDGDATLIYTGMIENGIFGGVVASGRTVAGSAAAGNVVKLTPLKGVGRNDFFLENGRWLAKAGGKTYPVAEKVWGYIAATEKWFSRDVETIRAYSGSMTVYVDPIGNQVRIIVV